MNSELESHLFINPEHCVDCKNQATYLSDDHRPIFFGDGPYYYHHQILTPGRSFPSVLSAYFAPGEDRALFLPHTPDDPTYNHCYTPQYVGQESDQDYHARINLYNQVHQVIKDIDQKKYRTNTRPNTKPTTE